MKTVIAALSASLALTAPAFAESHAAAGMDDDAMANMVAPTGDAEAGEKTFKSCKSCHSIINPETEEVIYKGGKTGPNLYGVAYNKAASVEDFRYSSSLEEAGEKGLLWDEENFIAFVTNSKDFLKEYLDDSGARSKMSYKLRKNADDVFAYLASVGPELPEMEEAEDTEAK